MRSPLRVVLFLTNVLTLPSFSNLHAAPVIRLYEITAGHYEQIGGIAGVWAYELPNAGEMFIELNTDIAMNTAELRFLDRGLNPSYSFAQFGTPLMNGRISGDVITFQHAVFPVFPYGGPGFLNYGVTLTGNELFLDGKLNSMQLCCDIPYRFTHSGVRAVVIPEPKMVGFALVLGFAALIQFRSRPRPSNHPL